jgi:hypothetical protein
VLPIPLRLKLIDFAQQANCSLPAKSICASPAARAFSHNQDPKQTFACHETSRDHSIFSAVRQVAAA